MLFSTAIRADGAELGRLTFAGIDGFRAVGQSSLSFTFEFTSSTGPAVAYQLLAVGGHLQLAEQVIAAFSPDVGMWASPTPTASSEQVRLKALVPFSVIRALEEHRASSDVLRLQVHLSALVQTLSPPTSQTGLPGALFRTSPSLPGQIQRTDFTPPYLDLQISSSDWRRVLSQMRWEDRVAFEVPLGGPSFERPPLDRLMSFLREAISHRDQHQWSAAVAQCREFFDVLDNLAPAPAPARSEWQAQDKRQQWSYSQRIAFIRAAVDHATNAAHHREELGDPTPDESRLIVELTALLHSFYSKSFRT